MNISNIQNNKTEVKNLPNGTPLRENDARSETSGSDDLAKNKPKAVAFMATRPPKKTEAKPGPTPPSIDHNQVSFDFAAQPVNDNPDNPLPPIPVIDGVTSAPSEATPTPPSLTEPQNEIVPTTPEPTTGATVPGSTLPSTPHPIFGYYSNFKGDLALPPIPLLKVGPSQDKSHDQTAADEAVDNTVAWVRRFLAKDDDDRVGRMRILVNRLQPLPPLLHAENRVLLSSSIALCLILREGHYSQLVDGDGRQLFCEKREFVSAFLRYHGLSDDESRVTYLVGSSDLWLQILEAGLPYPLNPGRLEFLVSLPLSVALKCYRKLCEAAGNQVPALEAIKDAAAELKGKSTSGAKVSAATKKLQTLVALIDEGRHLPAEFRRPGCDCEKLAAKLEELLAKMDALACGRPEAKSNEPQPGNSTAPKACPVTLAVIGGELIVSLDRTAADLATPLHVRALGKRWAVKSELQWGLVLQGGPSARRAKIGHVRERLTRLLEQHHYEAPLAPAGA